MDGWLTRDKVAVGLRVSIAKVRRLEGRELRPQRSEEGFDLFNPSEVGRAAAHRKVGYSR
jgi:hypothetical protein